MSLIARINKNLLEIERKKACDPSIKDPSPSYEDLITHDASYKELFEKFETTTHIKDIMEIADTDFITAWQLRELKNKNVKDFIEVMNLFQKYRTIETNARFFLNIGMESLKSS